MNVQRSFLKKENEVPGSSYTRIWIDLESKLGTQVVVECGDSSSMRFYQYQIAGFLNIATERTCLRGRKISQEVEDWMVEVLKGIVAIGVEGKYMYIGPQVSAEVLKLIEERLFEETTKKEEKW